MKHSPTSPVARQLAEWALALDLRDVDSRVIERVKLHMLDQIGAQVSCRNFPTPRIIQDYVSRFGVAGQSSILGTRLRMDPESAAFANATAGSSFEIDDYGANGAYAHPGCVVVPGALAIGEASEANGAALLRAAVAGFETVMRLAVATMPSLLVGRGFHQTAAHGVFAVALTSSMIEGHDLETAVNALAIAGSQASSTTEYAQSGGEVKRVHAGFGVAGGIRAARLARMGLTGPATIFEGRRGFLQAFCDTYDARPLHEGLGTRWYFAERAAIKPHAACALVHHHFAAYDKLKAEHAFLPDDIEEIVLGCEPLALVHNGAAGPRPTDILGAQFSAEYGMGMRVIKGRNDVGAYLDAQASQFQDPAITAVAERVRIEADPDCAAEIPMGRVTLRMRNGTALSATGYALGSPLNPLASEDVKRKYRELVIRDFGEKIAEESMAVVMDLENVKDLRQLSRLFEASPSSIRMG